MLDIAIVDDEQKEINTIEQYISRYEDGKDRSAIYKFDNALDLLSSNRSFDIVFFDIQMPILDGMNAAGKLREKDDDCVIIFITRMAQYAISGYAVNAMDFLLKPLTYQQFAMRFKKAVDIASRNKSQTITINVKNEKIRINLKDVVYVESLDHQIIWHTVKGNFSCWDTLGNIYERIRDHGFAYCNRSQIVNIKFIHVVGKNEVVLKNNTLETLSIGRSMKKEFMDKVTLLL